MPTGSVLQIAHGDAAAATKASSMTYDARRRLSTAPQTYRGAPALWSQQPSAYSPAPNLAGPPSTLQRLLADLDFHYDAVDNPVEIDDWRSPSEWPAGAQPVTRKMQYDDLYRLSQIDYQYASGGDARGRTRSMRKTTGHRASRIRDAQIQARTFRLRSACCRRRFSTTGSGTRRRRGTTRRRFLRAGR